VQEHPYRFLICADKYQTGYDEPLLHTMYVDKVLSGIKAVQTLSRLNRARPQKYDTFVLDFMNDVTTIQAAFEPYYRTTILADQTDANKLHDLKNDLDQAGVYAAVDINDLVALYLGGADREKLDPILDSCVALYLENLDEDGQVEFKGKAKGFVRSYGFLSAILPYTNAEWEKLSIFLNFLVPKLPAPKEEDLSKGILDAIDMDSYRVEKNAAVKIHLPDQDVEIEAVPTDAGGGRAEPELDRLSNILKTFNDQFGGISWSDRDRIRKLVTEESRRKCRQTRRIKMLERILINRTQELNTTKH
jgi:type I restriction enzyme, R subunit